LEKEGEGRQEGGKVEEDEDMLLYEYCTHAVGGGWRNSGEGKGSKK